VRKGNNPHFRIDIKGGEKGTLTICNAKGQVLQTYHLIAGHHYLTWEGSGCSSGIYIYRLVTPSVKTGGKLVIVK
jgi:hypothetical protein